MSGPYLAIVFFIRILDLGKGSEYVKRFYSWLEVQVMVLEFVVQLKDLVSISGNRE